MAKELSLKTDKQVGKEVVARRLGGPGSGNKGHGGLDNVWGGSSSGGAASNMKVRKDPAYVKSRASGKGHDEAAAEALKNLIKKEKKPGKKDVFTGNKIDSATWQKVKNSPEAKNYEWNSGEGLYIKKKPEKVSAVKVPKIPFKNKNYGIT